MAAHCSQIQLAGYRDRTLAPAEIIAVDDHLIACAQCQSTLRSLRLQHPAITKSIDKGLLSADEEAEFHLDYDEHLAPYVDGTINNIDREIVESHLELCADCAGQARELLEVKEDLARLLPAEEPQAVRAPPLLAKAAPPRNWVRQHPARTALATAVLFSLFVEVVILLRRPGPPVEIAPPVQSKGEAAKPAPRTPNTPAETQPQMPPTQADTALPTPDTTTTTVGRNAISPQRGAGRKVQEQADRPQVVARLNDGGRIITLDSRGNVGGLEAQSPELRQGVRVALTGRRIATPAEIAALIGRDGVVRGGSAQPSFALMRPVGTFVRAARPTLRWQAVPGADSYIVTIYDAKRNAVAASPPLTATDWTPPAPLRRGVIYSWQVTARKDERQLLAPAPTAPEAKFKLIGPEQAESLRQAEQTVGDAHLLRGVLYAQAGLLDEAEGEFQALLDSNPNSPAARRLHAGVRALRAPRK